MRIAKPLPQFAHGAFVRITKKGGVFGKPGAVMQVVEDYGTGLVLTVPGHGGVLHATHDQVEPAAPPMRHRVRSLGRVVADNASGDEFGLPDVEG